MLDLSVNICNNDPINSAEHHHPRHGWLWFSQAQKIGYGPDRLIAGVPKSG